LFIVSTKLQTNSSDMKKKTGIHKEVFRQALVNRFITLDEARSIAKSDKTARMILYRLSKKGQLLRVKAGLYAAIPVEMNDPSIFEINRYLLANRLCGPRGAIAFHSALEVHGVANSHFDTVYYLVDARPTPFQFQDIFYRPVGTGNVFGIMDTYVDGISVRVTDKERTFLDCLRRLDLCGGLEEFLKSIEGFTLMSGPKLLDYLERFREQSLYQRTGYVLMYLKDRIKVPGDLIAILRDRVGSNKYYLVPEKNHSGGRLVKEWNIFVPHNIEEMNQFA
jgi:predicted transcriptional regulator of viral defense system